AAAPTAPAPAAGHAVYSLVDNRLAGHLGRGGGLLIPGGSAGFAKYVRFGNTMAGNKRAWILRDHEGDVKVARLDGKHGSLFVPLTAAQARTGSIRLRVHADKAGTLEIKVNDHAAIRTEVASDWSTVEVTAPAGQLVAGENQLELAAAKSGLALAWAQLGATTAATDADASFFDPSAKALVVPRGGAMTWYAAIPDHASLTADVGGQGCKVDVAVTADDGATASGTLGAGAIDLGALAGKAARIELANASCDRAAIAQAALTVPGAAPTAAKAAAPKYVVFVIMDSLRADRVRAFNPKARPDAPNWDKLAESSTLFTSHYVQGNESQVSHASMWSSNYLIKHKAQDSKNKLSLKWTTIDEVAKAAGKYTAGASANGYIRPARGFGSAWDKYVNHIEKSLGLKGKDVLEQGLAFIEPHKTQPWFLYMGFIDTHVTWRAKKPWIAQYDGGYSGRFATEFGDDGPGGMPQGLSDREKDHVRALYDSNVSYQDDLLGKLVAQLQAWGVWDDTMLIVTADHGDEQWEDGKIGHGGSEHETLIHVPLLVHYPALFPAGKIVGGSEGIDIVPTVAEALGVPADGEWQGMSLVAEANGGDVYPTLATSSKYENGHAGRIGHWKIMLAGPTTPKLYDLAKDPGERSDRFGDAQAAIGARLLLDPMWTFRSWNVEWKKARWGAAGNVTAAFAEDMGE
ncbi:MAG: sulfatase, partial [Deltaproteobacteria bacterium]|nr:sulfatase [Deltaproteobacteria bacterium]